MPLLFFCRFIAWWACFVQQQTNSSVKPEAALDIFQFCRHLVLTLSNVVTCYPNARLICIIHKAHHNVYVESYTRHISISATVLCPLADIKMFQIIGTAIITTKIGRNLVVTSYCDMIHVNCLTFYVCPWGVSPSDPINLASHIWITSPLEKLRWNHKWITRWEGRDGITLTFFSSMQVVGTRPVINRPGIVRAVLQTALLLIDWFSQSVSEPFPPDLHNIINHKH